MRRVRIALLAVSAAVLALVVALAWRAQQGLLAERALRHRAVAERAFEEMERVLGDWLEREEERPLEHYASALPGGGEPLPLWEPLEPFVLGAFALDADGALRTAREAGDPAAAEAIARVRRALVGLWSRDEGFADAEAEADAAPESAPRAAQAPGTTRALSGPGVDDAPEQAGAGALAKGEAGSAYDVLQSLNREARERSDRKQKQVLAPAPRADALAEVREGAEALRGVEPSADAAGAAPAPERVALRVAVEPMLGVQAGDDALVLYRTVLAGGRAHRQGLVLDRARLGVWLAERVIRGSALADVAELRFDADASAPPAPGTRYLFAHRFAEPFDALHAELALAALPGAGSPGALAALVAVLLAVGAAGLFAVHRTASVVLQYAERRSNFTAAVSHELKTPLTAIRMYAEMLRDDLVPSEEKRRAYYRTITDESERLSRLVDNVLEFSKLEGGRRELRLEPGDVGPLLREAAEKLSAHAAREGFALRVECEPGLPRARFDRDALLQVLYNLVDNAVKYARAADDKRVVLAARAEGGELRVSVRDFGPGVAHAHQGRVFEPFYRAQSELTRSAQGTGIGLALVRELAERMGARVRGANAEGGGFRVELRFPVAERISS